MKNKIISLILLLTMSVGIVATLGSCSEPEKTAPDALVIMTEELDGLFSPFFSTSGTDATIVGMTQISMLTYGYANGRVSPAWGDNEAVVTKDFEQKSENGKTTYTFVLKNGIKFSDGHPLTMEDVLFNMYVYLDPVYTGSSTMYSTDIVGLNDYRTQTNNALDNTDDQINIDAKNRAAQRINELLNLFTQVKKSTGTNEATYDQMIAAINTHTLSPGYKSAISNNASSVTTAQLKADYELTLKYFKEELATDYDTAKSAYTEEPYKSQDAFTGAMKDINSFMYYENMGVEVKFGTKITEDGKEIENADKSKINEVIITYPSSIDTMEEAIQYVYDAKINSALDEILRYWATSQKLETEYVAKAKEVILHASESSDGLKVPNISGIVSLGHTTDETSVVVNGTTYNIAKTHNADGTPANADEYDVLQITINGVDPKAVWNFAFSVAPQHYYAEGYSVDIAGNNFGVEYASFDFMRDVIQSKNSVPMGAGAYMATNANNDTNPQGYDFFSGGVVYFKANNSFLLGEPATEKIRYQVVSATNAIGALKDGSVHYVSPQLTPYNEQQLASMKSSGFDSIAVDQLGYGYIGINAGKVPNIYLRKAIMAAMNTELALKYYTPGSAEKIYWPMSTVSWAYPKDELGNNEENNLHAYPVVAFDENVVRAVIQDYMNDAANHNGGYDEDDLKITFTIAGANLTDHPTYNVFQSAAELLNSMGWDIEVVADTNALTKLTTGSLAVWAAAWGTTVDPDMYQVYHKNSTATSVYAWGYREILNSADTIYRVESGILDAMSILIDQARETNDENVRTGLYREAMGYVLDLAVELPVYQRKVLYAYNTNVIDASSIPSASEINPYSSPLDRIWEIKLVSGD